jgi:hypothetical protein
MSIRPAQTPYTPTDAMMAIIMKPRGRTKGTRQWSASRLGNRASDRCRLEAL